jgi:hypothetical protein
MSPLDTTTLHYTSVANQISKEIIHFIGYYWILSYNIIVIDNSIFSTLHLAQYTTQYNMLSTVHYTQQSTFRTVHYATQYSTIHSVQYTQSSALSTVHSVQCTQYSALSTVHSVHYTQHSILHSVQYSALSIVYTTLHHTYFSAVDSNCWRNCSVKLSLVSSSSQSSCHNCPSSASASTSSHEEFSNSYRHTRRE